MNNVGVTELFLIFIVVLLVMGPERMLQMAAQMGHWYGYLQRQWRNARIMLQAEVDQVSSSSPAAAGDDPVAATVETAPDATLKQLADSTGQTIHPADAPDRTDSSDLSS